MPLSPYRHTGLSIANNASYRCAAFNLRGQARLGVAIRCDKALSVKLAYGRQGVNTAAVEGVNAASLPFSTPAQTFASSDAAEGGTYHVFEVPTHATLAQLVLSNASGATATVAFVDYDIDPVILIEKIGQI